MRSRGKVGMSCSFSLRGIARQAADSGGELGDECPTQPNRARSPPRPLTQAAIRSAGRRGRRWRRRAHVLADREQRIGPVNPTAGSRLEACGSAPRRAQHLLHPEGSAPRASARQKMHHPAQGGEATSMTARRARDVAYHDRFLARAADALRGRDGPETQAGNRRSRGYPSAPRSP